jgi:hypothetical protein
MPTSISSRATYFSLHLQIMLLKLKPVFIKPSLWPAVSESNLSNSVPLCVSRDCGNSKANVVKRVSC